MGLPLTPGSPQFEIYMESSLNLFAIITMLGAAQGLLLALALLGLKKGDRVATRLLAVFMLTSAILVTGSLLNSTKYVLAYPHLSQVATPFHFLFGPIIFLYVKSLTCGEWRFRKKEFWHFVPFLLCAAYYAPLYASSEAYKIDYMLEAFRNYPPVEWRVRSGLLLAQALPYLALTLKLFAERSREYKANPSPEAGFMLFWLRTFMLLILITLCAGLFRLFFGFTVGTMLLVPLCFTGMVYVAGYMALKHPDALTGARAAPVAVHTPPARKYEKSALAPERANVYLKQLLDFMDEEKPYRDGDLTIQKLAEMLSIQVNHLSQVINEKLGQNFFDFVNAYRVKEVQKLLVDPAKKHYTILAIAEEVGFRSKSAFNAVFKKHTSMTPTEFRKLSGGSG
jgi:AraC-like DNA-binding protein